MMPTSKNPLLLIAAALVLGWSMLGPMPTVAQDDRTSGGTPVTQTSTSEASATQTATPTAPPRNLKKVGDHWTPYDPPDPESLPVGATLHIITTRETLWVLADLTYNNPYLWPQL